MCEKAKCKQCGKYSYSGCGYHIHIVLRGIDSKDICKCNNGKPKCVK